jgi:1-acyl-sn-glycerol-3-phosphate acyltransferase
MLQQTWYMLGRAAVGAYARTMLKMDISQRAPLPKGAKIIAANHPTTADPIWIGLLTLEPMHVLITEMCFKVPLVGQSLRLAGHVPVVTGNGRAAFDEAARLLEAGQTVGIFPEGALSPLDGGLEKPHTGVARLALISGAPVIPVGIHLQRERIRFVETTVGDDTETARWYLHGPYAMTVGEPMRFEGDVEDRRYVRSISERIMQRIARLSRESAQRICAPQAAQSGDWLSVPLARAH